MKSLQEQSVAITTETISPSRLNALKWLQTSKAYLAHRIVTYQELGNQAAADSLSSGPQVAMLDFLKQGVESDNSDIVDFVSGLEIEASDGRPYDSPNYVVIHGQQLDKLALAVERAQAQYDDTVNSLLN